MSEDDFYIGERRQDPANRDLIERVADRAAEKAIQRFGELTPFDMSTKDGRDRMRLTIAHANFLREGCDAIKSDGMQMARRGALTLIGLSLVIGTAWLLGANPDRVFKLFGGGGN